MREIVVPVGERRYPILIGSGLLDRLGESLRSAGISGSIALAQDAAVAPTYGARAFQSLQGAGYRVTSILIPSGEESKSLSQLGKLYDALAGAGLDRRSAIVALGGGVTGDLAGFAAATYLRGLDLVQVPTTLLAQVDSSVGGKTGIDLPAGKNLVGAFHQPRLVLVDPETLLTLPEREFRAGLAEVLKYGVIQDVELFRYLEANREAVLAHQREELTHLIARSCEIKAEIVGQDERESGLRAILNYGHTVGHAIEAVAGYGRYAHGEAVAIGMRAEGWLSQRMGWLPEEDARRIEELIRAYGLPLRLEAPLSVEALLQAMRLDKKAHSDELRFVLARRIGQVEVTAVSEGLAREAAAVVQPA